MMPHIAYLSLDEHTKTSRPNRTTTPVTIAEFTPDIRICPLATLKSYIKKTEKLRDGENKARLQNPGPILKISLEPPARRLGSQMNKL